MATNSSNNIVAFAIESTFMVLGLSVSQLGSLMRKRYAQVAINAGSRRQIAQARFHPALRHDERKLPYAQGSYHLSSRRIFHCVVSDDQPRQANGGDEFTRC